MRRTLFPPPPQVQIYLARSAPVLQVQWPFIPQAPEGWRTPGRCAFVGWPVPRASVWECGGPPPLGFPPPPK